MSHRWVRTELKEHNIACCSNCILLGMLLREGLGNTDCVSKLETELWKVMCQITILIWQHVFQFCVFRIHLSSSELPGVNYWFGLYFRPYLAKRKKLKSSQITTIYITYTISFMYQDTLKLDHLFLNTWQLVYHECVLLFSLSSLYHGVFTYLKIFLAGERLSLPGLTISWRYQSQSMPEHAFATQTHAES